jgi:hypothetical protein
MTMTTEQKLAKLKTLRDSAGKTTFERIKLACAVYEDRDWVGHFADDAAAEAHLQEEYLADLCGTVSFLDCYRILQAVPQEEDWKRCKFNLRRLYALMEERQPTPKEPRSERRRPMKADDAEALQEDLKNAEVTIKRREDESRKLYDENEQLRQKVARLEGRIEELERMLQMKRSA